MTSRRDPDDVAARLTVLAMTATLAVATWIAFRSWGALGAAALHPLALTEAEALWAGLVASDLMVLQGVLLARLPWLERTWGRARLTRWHRQAAYWSFWLLVVHVLLFVLQRGRARPDDVGGALADLFLHERHLLLATIGTAMVLVVVLTSIAAARSRLRYETWHLAHLWSYAGLGLALPHQLTSADFVDLWVRVWWWSLYVGAVVLLVGFRVLRPAWVSRRHRLCVLDVVPEAGGAVSVTVGGRDVVGLGARSGQFLTWRFAGRGRTRGHPYSLSAAPGRTLRLTVAGAGDGAEQVARLRPGARVAVEGPFGHLPHLLATGRRHPHLLLMAAGVGVTPFRALLEDLPYAPGELTLVQRAHDADAVLFAAEVDALAAARGVAVVRLVGPRRSAGSFLPEGHDGAAEEVLLALAPHLLASDVVLCGPAEWMETVRRVARSAGVRERDLHREAFGW